MQNQLPLFLSYSQVRELPIVSKYEKIFDELDLSGFPEFNFGVGANGISQHALLRAFIIRSLESLNTVSALIRFLQANPALICLCGFRNQRIPHDSQFYRFLKKINHSAIENLLHKANRTLIKENALSLNITAVDSKPIKAEPIICLNPRNTQPHLTYSEKGHRICQAGLEMIPSGVFKDGNRLRLKERCPLKASKKSPLSIPMAALAEIQSLTAMDAQHIRISLTTPAQKCNVTHHGLRNSTQNAL